MRVYVADKRFADDQVHERWLTRYSAEVIIPPHLRSKYPSSRDLRRWLVGLRQIVETIYEKLLYTFRLARERPHALDGFQAHLVAQMALHIFSIWTMSDWDVIPLAFAELFEW